MAKAKKNPIGRYFKGVIPVLIGRGTLVHIYHPFDERHICNSGKNAGRPPRDGEVDQRGQKEVAYYKTRAKYITCWRCLKLGVMNEKAGREAWDRGDYGF